MNNKITVIINAYNEEKAILATIASARNLSDQILVVDMESTDKTAVIVQKDGATMLNFKYSQYVEPAREYAIKKAQTEWVFLLDCDERITDELAEEVKKIVNNTVYSYFKIPRKNFFLEKKWLKHGGWYPDYVIRLIKTAAFQSWPPEIHSTPQIMGDCGILHNPLLHFFHPNIENMVEKTAIYEDIESQMLFQAKRKANTVIFFRKFLGELYRRLIKSRGYKDGSLGIIESIYQAYSKTITYIYLYEKYQKNSSV